jgi:hypothetical protein
LVPVTQLLSARQWHIVDDATAAATTTTIADSMVIIL